MSKVSGKWNKENISNLLLTNDRMVVKSLIDLYKKQTVDERRTESTTTRNKIKPLKAIYK